MEYALERTQQVRDLGALEGPRALFDRAVVWLIGSQVLLPGITTLARMVAEVRQEENDRLGPGTRWSRRSGSCPG